MSLANVRDVPTGTRLAALCLGLALVLDLVLLVRVRHLRDASSIAPLQIAAVKSIVLRTRDDAELVRQAEARAPFDATPSATDFVAAQSVVPQSVVAPPVRPRLIGTVVEGTTGGFVVIELPNAHMQVVRIGERAGDLRLRSITAGEAVFDDQHGSRVSLRTPHAGLEGRP